MLLILGLAPNLMIAQMTAKYKSALQGDICTEAGWKLETQRALTQRLDLLSQDHRKLWANGSGSAIDEQASGVSSAYAALQRTSNDTETS